MPTRLVLVDRLFLLLDGLQGPNSLNLYATSFDAALELDVLRLAAQDLLAEQPLLRTRASCGSFGMQRLARAHEDVDTIFEPGGPEPELGVDSPGELAFARRRLDLATMPPFRLLARNTPTGGRLLMMLHHSVADGVGGYFVIDRLGAHYAARLEGRAVDPPPEAPPRPYRSYFRRFTPAERRRALLGTANVVRELLFDLGPYAVFGDMPPPACGEFTWRELPLPLAHVPALRAAARARGGTLNDLLLAATAEAGVATWPQPTPLPVLVMVPVSLRDGPTVDMTNRVAELPIKLPYAACLEFEAAFEVARERTPLARDRARAFARICQYALASRLPPPLARQAVARSLARKQNHALSYVFSNTGILDPQPRDFATARVTSVGGMPPLTFPPGLGIVAATSRGRLTLTVAWTEPALARASVEAFCERLLARLAGLAGEGH